MSQNDQHEQQNDSQQIPNVQLNVQTEIVKAKPTQKIYKCKKCGKEFTSRSAYNAHIWEHTKQEREKAKAEKAKVETEVVKAKIEEKTKINVKEKVISVWEKAKWYIIGSVFVVIFFVLYWYWKKKKEKEEGKQ